MNFGIAPAGPAKRSVQPGACRAAELACSFRWVCALPSASGKAKSKSHSAEGIRMLKGAKLH